MASSVTNQIIQNANNTVQAKASQQTVKESSSSVSSQDFLYLLTQQLQYQDPMNPMDNSEMLAQEAQFATLEQMEALTSSFSEFSNVYQANSLLGQNIEVTVDGKTTKGVVDYVDYSDSSGASVSVGGNMYPLSSVTKVYPEETAATEDDSNFFKAAAESIAGNVYNIANKLVGYENNDIADTSSGTTTTDNQN